MRSMTPIAGLAYCLGGRSLYWGGWSPRLTDVDLNNWPTPIATYLQSTTHSGDAYERVEKETGVFDKTDYISGPLFEALKKKFKSVAGGVTSVDVSSFHGVMKGHVVKSCGHGAGIRIH